LINAKLVHLAFAADHAANVDVHRLLAEISQIAGEIGDGRCGFLRWKPFLEHFYEMFPQRIREFISRLVFTDQALLS